MPIAALTQIVSFIGLAAQAAKDAKPIYDEGKKLITSLFEQGLISKDQQDATMTWADAHQAAVLAGDVPPEFQVE